MVLGLAVLAGCAAYILPETAGGVAARLAKWVPRKQANLKEQMFPVAGALAGAVAGLLLGTNPRVVVVTMWIGLAAGYFARRVTRTTDRFVRLREAARLFKGIGNRLQNGYSPRYALQVSAAATPALRHAVARCLQHWPFDEEQAIEELRRRMGVPEADTLCQVMKRAHQAGGEKVADVLIQGARNLEHKLEALEEKAFITGQMRYLFYRLLPALSIAVLVAGSFAYHVHVTLRQAVEKLH